MTEAKKIRSRRTKEVRKACATAVSSYLSIETGRIHGEAQPDTRQPKRKASHELDEDEEGAEGDSNGRNSAAPKRVRLQEPAQLPSPQGRLEHLPAPSTPSGSPLGPKTVLQKGLHLLRNFGGTVVSIHPRIVVTGSHAA